MKGSSDGVSLNRIKADGEKTMRKTTQLRQLISGPGLGVLMEAHNALSAKLVEEARFEGIWASSLTLSASMGLRDNNEASWTQTLDTLEFMSDCTSIPILFDGDTGFGNFNNVRRLVRKLESRNIAGVCIEDKIFPKTNSFISGEQQALAPIEEFCGKIKAGKDTQQDDDFVLVARVESFIAGWGIEETLKRALAYSSAGADAILVHSKIDSADQILAFMERWDSRKPVVIVPTTYCRTPPDVFAQAGISAMIWANHTLRITITALQKELGELKQSNDLAALNDRVVTVQEVFRLQDAEELQAAETRYLPRETTAAGAVILAASKGDNFGSLTDDKPKAMIPIFGKPILASIVGIFNDCGIKDISCVVGYKKESVTIPGVRCIDNEQYDKTGLLVSLNTAAEQLAGDTVIAYGDVLFEHSVLRELLETDADITMVADTSHCHNQSDSSGPVDLVVGSNRPNFKFKTGRIADLVEMTHDKSRSDVHGEWIGLIRLSESGCDIFRSQMEAFSSEEPEAFARATMAEFFMRLVANGISVKVLYVYGRWFDIDSIEDVSDAYTMGDSLS